jgi:hypothetical protein
MYLSEDLSCKRVRIAKKGGTNGILSVPGGQ